MKLKMADNDRDAPEKWKMKFAKDERQIDTKQKIPGKFGFNYESEEEDQARNFQSQAPVQSSYPATSTSGLYESKSKQRSPPHKPKMEVVPVPAPVLMVNKGPVVLDKFGNFRLADPTANTGPPRPLEPTTSTRRSCSRSHRRSRSRSDSRYRRRHSRSRSYSRFDMNLSTKCYELNLFSFFQIVFSQPFAFSWSQKFQSTRWIQLSSKVQPQTGPTPKPFSLE